MTSRQGNQNFITVTLKDGSYHDDAIEELVKKAEEIFANVYSITAKQSALQTMYKDETMRSGFNKLQQFAV